MKDSTLSSSPIARPAPAAFNMGEAIQKIKDLCQPDTGNLQENRFYQLDLPKFVTPQEAEFWIYVISEINAIPHRVRPNGEVRDVDINSLLDKVQAKTFSGEITLQSITTLDTRKKGYFPFPQLAKLLFSLFSIQEAITGLYAMSHSHYRTKQLSSDAISCCFRQYWEYRTPDDVIALQEFFSGGMEDLKRYCAQKETFQLMLKLEIMQEQLLKLVKSWQPSLFDDGYFLENMLSPQRIILGLEDPEEVNSQMRRLKLPLKIHHESGEYKSGGIVQSWVERTQADGLDYAYNCILQEKSRTMTKSMVSEFARAKAPGIAVCMLKFSIESKAAEEARAWLRKHPNETIQELIPIAAKGDRLARAALKWLKDLSLKGHTEQIVSAIDQQPAEIADKLRDQILEAQPPVTKAAQEFDDQTTPAWLTQALATVGQRTRSKLPPLLPEAALPSILINGIGLPSQHIALLIAALKKSKFDSPHPLVVAIKHHADSASTDQFALALLGRWQLEDMPKKEKWVMQGLAHLVLCHF